MQKELTLELFQEFIRLSRIVQSHRKQHLMPAWHNVLHCIIHMEEEQDGNQIKASLLSRRMHLTQPTITPILNRLEEMGYITREQNKRDRRAAFLHTTEKGRQAHINQMKNLLTKSENFIEYMTEEKTTQLIELLAMVTDYLTIQLEREEETMRETSL